MIRIKSIAILLAVIVSALTAVGLSQFQRLGARPAQLTSFAKVEFYQQKRAEIFALLENQRICPLEEVIFKKIMELDHSPQIEIVDSTSFFYHPDAKNEELSINSSDESNAVIYVNQSFVSLMSLSEFLGQIVAFEVSRKEKNRFQEWKEMSRVFDECLDSRLQVFSQSIGSDEFNLVRITMPNDQDELGVAFKENFRTINLELKDQIRCRDGSELIDFENLVALEFSRPTGLFAEFKDAAPMNLALKTLCPSGSEVNDYHLFVRLMPQLKLHFSK